MAKLKSARHHWWPECVSARWADGDGGVSWLSPDGQIRRAAPKNFGLINNGHHIKMGKNPSEDSAWDQIYESEFDDPDSNFPGVIDWLSKIAIDEHSCDRPMSDRFIPHEVSDDRLKDLFQCLVSLAARSPMHREKGVALAEHLRGPLPEHERNTLIGLNIRHTYRNAIRSVAGAGKTVLLQSPDREFIFGDGFFSNLTVNGEFWHTPKLLVPVTPSLAVLHVRPTSYMTLPKFMSLRVSPEETKLLNEAVHVYSRNKIYYRSEQPELTSHFTVGEHQTYADHRNTVEQLIESVPGTTPRSPAYDFLDEFKRRAR